MNIRFSGDLFRHFLDDLNIIHNTSIPMFYFNLNAMMVDKVMKLGEAEPINCVSGEIYFFSLLYYHLATKREM